MTDRIPAPWPGTTREAGILQTALERNCTCPDSPNGPPNTCPVHAVWEDEKALAHLVFYRRIAGRLEREERTRGQEPHVLHGRPEEHAG